MSQPSPSFSVSSRRVSFWLVLGIAAMTLSNIVAELFVHFSGRPKSSLLIRFATKFTLDSEHSVPAFFSVLLLLTCALLLGLMARWLARSGGRYASQWGLLALIFLYISVDEDMTLHELLIQPVRAKLHLTGFLHYSWVAPAGILLVILALFYWRFWRALPTRSRWLIFLAGALYVGGAFGLEMVGGKLAEVYGTPSLIYHVVCSVEELAEMVGLTVFIYALIEHIRTQLAPAFGVTITA